ncbi:HNH endonuclease [Pseudomonas sp. 20GA0148]|nr:HNH endonuclease [Pseudomonas alliivorans]
MIYALHYGIDPGAALVDHRDGNRANNDPLNLRLCSVAQNTQNQTLARHNRSGVKGLSYWAVRNRWRCEVGINGKRATRSFSADQKAEAVKWLRTTRETLHREFTNHGNCSDYVSRAAM